MRKEEYPETSATEAPKLQAAATGQDALPDQQNLPPAENRGRNIVLVIGAILLVGILVAGLVLLIGANNETTGKVRDIFIIFMALESLVVGVALIILMIQLAVLINLLQNEIRPILESTNQTVNTLRGTVSFLSNNLVEPVIKLNTYLAGVKKVYDLFRGK